jgi:hypothetical protein
MESGEAVAFTTCETTHRPHVTIHNEGCVFVRQHGGTHKQIEGHYRTHKTYEEALAYAETTKLPLRNCFFCSPV